MIDALTIERGVAEPKAEERRRPDRRLHGMAGVRASKPVRLPRLQAFTLIEIMIVVAIVGILLVVGLPAFTRAFQKEGMRKAVNDMLEACGHARAQAVLTGVPTELAVRFDGSEITLSVVQAAQAATEEYAPPPPASKQPRRRFTPFHATLPENVAFELLDVNFQSKLEAEEARVRFYPTGTSDEFAVVLLSTDQERRLIFLDVVTGLAELETDPQRFLLRQR
jgi:prepilin-type N-terminal cleavage/methylation domain-containing protein